MNKLRQVTNILLITTALVWFVYDLFAYWKGGTPATISRVILDFSQYSPSIVFIFAYLCGHFFFPQKIITTKGDRH